MRDRELDRRARGVGRELGLMLACVLGCNDEAATSAALAASAPSDVTGPSTDGIAASEVSQTGSLQLTFVQPLEGAVVDKSLIVEVVASGDATLQAMVLTSPAGTTDSDPTPGRLLVTLDLSGQPNGPLVLEVSATDDRGAVTTKQRTVQVVHPVGGRVRGFASLGNPVVGADVRLLKHGGLQRGASLGTAATGPDGYFDLAVTDAAYYGRAVLVVGGVAASVKELHQSDVTGFLAPDELVTTLDYDPKVGVAGIMVNGATTLATVLAESFALSGVQEGKAVSEAEALIVAHLSGSATFSVWQTPVPALTQQSATWPSAAAAVGLLHAGLSWMAREANPKTSTASLVTALARDMTDGIFNGQGRDGAPVPAVGGLSVEVETTRWKLAQAVDLFLKGEENGSGLSYDHVSGKTGFLTLVSTDTSKLYPPGPAARYDSKAPLVTFEAPTPGEGTWNPASLVVKAVATDDTAVTGLAIEASVQSGPPTINLAEGSLLASFGGSGLVDGPLSVTVTATDAAGNAGSTTRKVKIDGTPPTLNVTSSLAVATPDHTLTGNAHDVAVGLDSLTVTALVGGLVTVPTVAPNGSFAVQLTLVEGPNGVVFDALDKVGNAAKLIQSIVLDTQAPAVTFVAPSEGVFVPGGALPVTVTAVDATSAIAAVHIGVSGALVVALPAGESSEFVAVLQALPADGPVTLVAEAADAHGHLGTASRSVVRDSTPPTVTVGPIPGAVLVGSVPWVSAGTVTVSVMVTDAGSGVKSVCLAGTCGAAVGDVWTTSVTIGDTGFSGLVTATDQVGNAATVPFNVTRDAQGPTCVVKSSPGWVKATQVTLSGETLDGGVGGVVVTASSGTATATVSPKGAEWTLPLALVEGDNDVTVTCSDALGNSTVVPVGVFKRDTQAPNVLWGTTKYFRETEAPVELKGGVPTYGGEGLPLLYVSQVDCAPAGTAKYSCSTSIKKFSSRLRDTGGFDVVENNLPLIELVPTDPNPGSPASGIQLAYRFFRDGLALMKSRTVVPIDGKPQIPLAIESLTDGDPNTFAWSPATIPNRLEVTATDLAGNVSVTTWTFSFSVVAPPLFWAQVPSWMTNALDLSTYGLGQGNLLHNAFPKSPQSGGSSFVSIKGGVRVARHRVQNPYPTPMLMTLPVMGKVHLTVTSARTFLLKAVPASCSGTQACTSTAAPCKLSWTGPDATTTCGMAGKSPSVETRDHLLDVFAEVGQADAEDASQLTPLVVSNGAVTVPPGALVLVDLYAATVQPTTCLVMPPVSVKWYPKAPNSQEFILSNLVLEGTSCSGISPTSADSAVCGEGTFCLQTQYANPRVVTAVAVGPEPQKSVSAAVRYGVPGLGVDLAAPLAFADSGINYKTQSTDVLPTKPISAP